MPIHSSISLRLTPLAAALALAWPLRLDAAPPAANTVPIPASTWRVNGSGPRSAPVNTPNGKGGTSQLIEQTSARAIYQWQSFDIGSASDVTFDMAVTGASALNRVTGSTAPSQILGQLKATNKGEIYLINQNGILFGRGAQVNTGALIASGLNISDSEYLSGFAQSLSHPTDPSLNAAFRYDGDAANFVDSRNFVRVDEGATITAASGGRVFLFAKKVENAGQITAPDGQVMLAGGGAIYLKLPDGESRLYASETNPAISAVRGFLVEVGNGPADAPQGATGSASNLATGLISTPRGNTTLVGMAVNQMGRISATTSVSENGSVILRAQGNADLALNDTGNSFVMRAQDSGALVLGAGSSITIAPDDGGATTPATSTDTAGFATSHIDIAGRSVLFDSASSIVAPGATVNVRAEAKPSYSAHLTTDGGTLAAGDAGARIVLAENALIDVSGTTTAERSVADLFVATELLGSNDLKDAPVQKDGLLYRSKATIDTRTDSPILGSLDSYRAGIGRTVDERLSAGGHVDLRAEGAVLTHESSSLRVSGGQVRYTAADVQATRLVADNGAVYDLVHAPTDLVYTDAVNLEKPGAIQLDRWGRVMDHGGRAVQHEEGYTEGRAAGSVSIAAPIVALQGELKAGTTVGERQAAGLDKQAAAGRLTLGATTNFQQHFTDTSGTNPGPNAVLRDFTVSPEGPAVDAGVWSSPMDAALPAASGVSASRLGAAGFADITVVANGDVRFEHSSASPFRLADGGHLNLWSGYGDVLLAQDLRGASASVSLMSRERVTTDENGNPFFKREGRVEVADGVAVDLSGEWVNQWLAGPQATAYIGGGSFSASGFGVVLGEASVVDVSGGGSVSTKGVASGAAAGAIALQDLTLMNDASAPTLVLGGTLRGGSAQVTDGVASGGGSLSLKTTRVVISDDAADARPDALNLRSAFFSEGGFGSFAVDGRLSLDVASGTVVAPVQAVRQPGALARDVASADHPPAGALVDGLASGVRRGGVNLSLASSGDTVDDADGRTGVLTLGTGAVLNAGPQASVWLQAAHRLVDEGRIEAHGGTVSLAVASKGANESNHLWLGAGSVIDVSGTTLLTPDTTDGLLRGSVLDGGTISLSIGTPQSYLGSLVLQQGATLDARGATGLLDITERSARGVLTSRQTVASAGGSVSISGNSDMLLEGLARLQGGNAAAAGGSLAVTQLAGRVAHSSDDGTPYDPRELTLVTPEQQATAALTREQLAASAELASRAVVSADWVRASGAADFSVTTPGSVRVADDVHLDLARSLRLQSHGLAADAGVQAELSAASVWLGTARQDLQLGSAALPDVTPSEGDASLSLQARSGMVLDGRIATQGIGRMLLASAGDMRLQSREGPVDGRHVGGLDTRADLTMSAAQIYPSTDTTFTIDAPGRSIRFEGGDASVAKPLSAGGALVVNAATIEQAGVLRAPLGHIELHASEQLTLASGSETSVSAAGLDLLYGNVNSSSSTWTSPSGSALAGPPDKQVVLDSASVKTEQGSQVDVSGGGELIGTEFIPGKGGSSDILAAGTGAFAIVPGVQGLAPHDPAYASGAAGFGRQIVISQPVQLPDGSTLPAGRYTLLPARYAMLDGAFLIRPSGSSSLADGSVVARTDGSATIGARLADAGTAFTDALPGSWQLMSKAVALKYSEIRETRASEFFAARAASAGTAAPQGPRDGGSLVIQAQQADLQGQGRFAGAVADADHTSAGHAGTLEIVASAIQVDADAQASTDDGVLHLGASQLNQYAGGTIVLGGRSAGAGASGTLLDVQAQSVVFDQGANALSVSGLVAVATGSIDVQDGAVFRPPATTGSAPVSFEIEGGGAALRVDAAPGAGLQRHSSATDDASLNVGTGVVFDTGRGSLVLDSSGASHIARNARLNAADVLIAGGRLAVGAPGAPAGTLALSGRQLESLAQADRLTLRAYERMNFASGASLGSAALDQLVLDTPVLSVANTAQPVQVTAGDLTLTNTTGRAPGVRAGGSGQLSLSATSAQGGSGDVHLAAGHVGVAGAAALTITADHAVSLLGQGQLVASGDVTLAAPAIVAGEPAAEHGISTPGAVHIAARGTGAAPASADAGVFSVSAQSVDLSGRIVLPSGEVTLQGRDGVQLAAGARIDTAGRQVSIDDQVVNQAGGRVTLASAAGDVTLSGGSRVDVSGAGDTGRGGALGLSAAQGEVIFNGQLLGHAGDQAEGAQLSIDAGRELKLTRLAHLLEGGQFTGEIALRQREGDMTLSPGTTLAAGSIALQADAGRLTVAGTLDASGAQGGDIRLAAGSDLNVGRGAQLLAGSSQAGADGGRVELSSDHGWVRFMADSRIDVHAGEATDTLTPEGGRLVVRAQQRGHDVAAGAFNGAIEGAGAIDVQAVKAYTGYDALGPSESGTTLGQGHIVSDAARFLGADGANAEAIATRLTTGAPELSDALRIHAEAEVRASGDFTVAAGQDWQLPTESVDLPNAPHVGDTSLTLRAAGGLVVNRGLSSGLARDTGDATSDHGGSIRLVAGADLGAADAMATDKTSARTLTMAPQSADHLWQAVSFSGSSTGDVALAASGDIRLDKWGTYIETAGRQRDEAARAVTDRIPFYPGSQGFAAGGGDIRLEAGGSIRSSDRNPDAFEYTGLFAWARKSQTFDATGFAWYQAANAFNRGLMAQGGGSIEVRAGQDVNHLIALAPGSGYQLQDAATGTVTERHFNGGSVQVQAGRDVVDGMFEAGGAKLTVRAGRDIAKSDSERQPNPGTRLYLEDTAVQVDARRELTLSQLSSRHADYGNTFEGVPRNIQGLDDSASAQVTATSGHLTLAAGADFTNEDNALIALPDRTRLAAPNGTLSIDAAVLQQPALDGELVALAGQGLAVSNNVVVNATQARAAAGARWQTAEQALAETLGVLTDGDASLDQSGRSPVQLATAAGDLEIRGSAGLVSARPLRLAAGEDLRLSGTIVAQQQPDAATGAAREQTLLKAGRDIVFRDGTGQPATLQVAGPGEVLVLAGRDIDLADYNSGASFGSGLMATGNGSNGLLPKASAAVTLVAGLRSDGSDYAHAVARGFELVGATALNARAGDLYALMSATEGSPVVLGSAAATDFDARPPAEQIAALKALWGEKATNAALAAYVRGLPGHENDSDAKALAAYANLTPARQAAAPGSLLAERLVDVDATSRTDLLTQVAQADTPRYAAAFTEWMRLKTGRTLALGDAITAFEQLPMERQLGWLNQVLVEELRSAGRAAAVASGADKDAAYLRGYLAIDVVFPGARPAGDIRLPSTQVKTVQDAGTPLLAASDSQRAIELDGITVMAPGGGVNAGELNASGQLANNLGIVTVAGGDIAAVVREDFMVNQSRVFSLARGDILLWSSSGDIDAGRGAKTVTGAPAPVLRLDPNTGQLYLDTSGSFTGSGIAVLDEKSDLDLYAPAGAIDAGEAGIRARGNVFVGAVTVRGADNFQVGGNVVGATLGAVPVSVPAGLAPTASEAAKASSDDEEERRKRRRQRRQLLLDFLGFGRG